MRSSVRSWARMRRRSFLSEGRNPSKQNLLAGIPDIVSAVISAQAPGSDEEIHTFCTSSYSTTFPQMTKSDVNGDKQIPLYKFLKEQTNKADIRWNFTKFVIGRDGKVVKRFEPGDSLDELEKLIKSQLEQK